MAGEKMDVALEIVALEITELLLSRPAHDAAPEVRADWFARKAALFERIAIEDPHLYVTASEHAAQARALSERARRAG